MGLIVLILASSRQSAAFACAGSRDAASVMAETFITTVHNAGSIPLAACSCFPTGARLYLAVVPSPGSGGQLFDSSLPVFNTRWNDRIASSMADGVSAGSDLGLVRIRVLLRDPARRQDPCNRQAADPPARDRRLLSGVLNIYPALVRLNADGTIDRSFTGTGVGHFIGEPDLGEDCCGSVGELKLQRDGKIVVPQPPGPIAGSTPTARWTDLCRHRCQEIDPAP